MCQLLNGTFNDVHVSSLLANQSESHAYISTCRDAPTELARQAFPVGIPHVLDVTQLPATMQE